MGWLSKGWKKLKSTIKSIGKELERGAESVGKEVERRAESVGKEVERQAEDVAGFGLAGDVYDYLTAEPPDYTSMFNDLQSQLNQPPQAKRKKQRGRVGGGTFLTRNAKRDYTLG